MLDNEQGCIRYLMKEMDPSEEIEFERRMMKDENLLIEVETLRNTYAKLGHLPLRQPPEELSEKITEQAVRLQNEQIARSRVWTNRMSRSVAAAAVILLAVSTGIYFAGESGNSQLNPQNISNTATISNSAIQPWVDRNNTLHFAGTSVQDNNDQQLRLEVNQSFEKLRLVNSETGFNTSNRKILLTSSQR